MKLRYCCLLAAVALFAGCGKEERMEAVRFSKTLQQKSADFAKANAMEKDFLASARSWCESIMADGSGRGDQLKQNMAVAKDLAKSAAFISTQVGAVRQAVYDEPIKQEYPQSIRVNLITQLTKRQRFLQEARALLDDSGPGFLELGLGRDYKGDSYPDSIPKLNVLLEGPPARRTLWGGHPVPENEIRHHGRRFGQVAVGYQPLRFGLMAHA